MKISTGKNTFYTDLINPENINLYHFTTIYNTTTLRDEFIITPLISKITISTQKKYYIYFSFFSNIDAQANTNSIATVSVFGFQVITIRGYEPPVNFQIQGMELVIQPTSTTPIQYVPNPIQFRILCAGTIKITQINV